MLNSFILSFCGSVTIFLYIWTDNFPSFFLIWMLFIYFHTGFELKIPLGRQTLYHPSHAPSPFVSFIFHMESCLFALDRDSPFYTSHVVGFTGESHRAHLVCSDLNLTNFCPCWTWTLIFLFSASLVPGTIVMSHCTWLFSFFYFIFCSDLDFQYHGIEVVKLIILALILILEETFPLFHHWVLVVDVFYVAIQHNYLRYVLYS